MKYPQECKLKTPAIFDSHAHFDDKKFDGCRDKLLEELPRCGVCAAVTCGCDGASSKAALALAHKYPYIYAAVGIHPENLDSNTPISEIEALAADSRCVAIGEIGLDYYWNSQNKQLQKQFFEQQVLLAKRLDLPVIVHDRDAHEDTLEILLKHTPKGVVHCFSGSPESAKLLTDAGFYIGIGGVVTFKNSKKLPQVVEMLPQNKLLVETDCPYLAPEPYRGELCHSGYITLTAQKIAEIRGTTRDNILELSANNARNLFGIENI